MKKSILFFIVLTSILAGCSAPQVTVTPEATVTLTPPPTSTSTSTPTPTPVTANMSELDKQIFDAAPELEGVKKEIHNLWGVVGVDGNGEITKYLDYYEYNYNRGDWREVVREENGHLVILNAKGEEQIVYPERITINVNGEELVLNTTARGYLENRIPDTPGAKLAIAQELIRLSDEGKVLPKLAEDGMTLKDFWMKETFNEGGVISELLGIHSTDFVERRPDQLPSAFVIFSHIDDGQVVEGAYDTVVLAKQVDEKKNISTGAYWVTVVDHHNRIPYPQQIIDHDMFKRGGNAIVAPIRFKSLKDCVDILGNDMEPLCRVAMRDVPAVMEAVRSSISTSVVDSRLTSGELVVLADLIKVSE